MKLDVGYATPPGGNTTEILMGITWCSAAVYVLTYSRRWSEGLRKTLAGNPLTMLSSMEIIPGEGNVQQEMGMILFLTISGLTLMENL